MSDVGLMLIIPVSIFAFFIYHRKKFLAEKGLRLGLAAGILIGWPLGMFILHWVLEWDKEFSSLPTIVVSIPLGIIAIYIELRKGR